MARLPTVVDLGPTPRADASRPVASYAAGGAAFAQGVEHLGRGIAKLGEGVGEYELNEMRWQYAAADSHYESQAYERRAQLGEDTNYGPDADGKTMPQRYEADLNKLRDESSGMIQSPQMRERFRFHTDRQIARDVLHATTYARGLENKALDEHERLQAENVINKGVVSPDDEASMRLIDKQNELIDALAARRAITPVQALARKRNFAIQYATAQAIAHTESDPSGAIDKLQDPNSVYSIIPAQTRQNLLTRARSANDGEQELIRQDIKSDIVSMLNTGKGVPGIDAERIRRAYGPQGDKLLVQWQQQRADAGAIWTGTNDMGKLTEEGLAERVENYRPADGAQGYERKQRVYEAVGKQADAILKQRYSDPAAAVDDDKAVKAARADYVSLDPTSFRAVAAARMAAQAKLGIPEEIRSPLTKAEALRLTTPLSRMLPGQERETLSEMAKQFKEMFGEDADQAFEYALRMHKVDKATGETAARVMRKLGLGQPIGADEARGADQAKEAAAAEGAVKATAPAASRPAPQPQARVDMLGGQEGSARPSAPAASAGPAGGTPAKSSEPAKDQARMPTAEDVIALRRFPQKLQTRFDEKYGKGSAKKILETYPVGVPGRGPLSSMITGGQ